MSERVICIGSETVDRLRGGEMVEVSGVLLIGADSLRAPSEEKAVDGDNGLIQRARTLLTALQSIMLGDEAMPDPESMNEIARALTEYGEQRDREARAEVEEIYAKGNHERMVAVAARAREAAIEAMREPTDEMRQRVQGHITFLLHLLDEARAEIARLSDMVERMSAILGQKDLEIARLRERAICIGSETIDRLRGGETVEVSGVLLIGASSLRAPSEGKAVDGY